MNTRKLLVIGLISVLAACGSDSSSGGKSGSNGGDPSADLAYLQEQIDSLNLKIGELERKLDDRTFRLTPTAKPTESALLMKATADEASPPVLLEDLGCIPMNILPADVIAGKSIQCKTTEGYFVRVPWPDGGIPMEVDAWYEASGCMGTPYTRRLSKGVLRQGLVFSYGDAMRQDYVGYFAPNPPTVELTVRSVWNLGRCEEIPAELAKDLVPIVPITEADVDENGLHAVTGALNFYPAFRIE